MSRQTGRSGPASGVLRGVGLGVLAGLAIAPIWLLISLIPETRVYSAAGAYAALFGILGGGGMGGIFGALAGTITATISNYCASSGAGCRRRGLQRRHPLRAHSGGGPQRGRKKSDEALSVLKRSGAVDLSQVRGGGALASQRGTH